MTNIKFYSYAQPARQKQYQPLDLVTVPIPRKTEHHPDMPTRTDRNIKVRQEARTLLEREMNKRKQNIEILKEEILNLERRRDATSNPASKGKFQQLIDELNEASERQQMLLGQPSYPAAAQETVPTPALEPPEDLPALEHFPVEEPAPLTEDEKDKINKTIKEVDELNKDLTESDLAIFKYFLELMQLDEDDIVNSLKRQLNAKDFKLARNMVTLFNQSVMQKADEFSPEIGRFLDDQFQKFQDIVKEKKELILYKKLIGYLINNPNATQEEIDRFVFIRLRPKEESEAIGKARIETEIERERKTLDQATLATMRQRLKNQPPYKGSEQAKNILRSLNKDTKNTMKNEMLEFFIKEKGLLLPTSDEPEVPEVPKVPEIDKPKITLKEKVPEVPGVPTEEEFRKHLEEYPFRPELKVPEEAPAPAGPSKPLTEYGQLEQEIKKITRGGLNEFLDLVLDFHWTKQRKERIIKEWKSMPLDDLIEFNKEALVEEQNIRYKKPSTNLESAMDDVIRQLQDIIQTKEEEIGKGQSDLENEIKKMEIWDKNDLLKAVLAFQDSDKKQELIEDWETEDKQGLRNKNAYFIALEKDILRLQDPSEKLKDAMSDVIDQLQNTISKGLFEGSGIIGGRQLSFNELALKVLDVLEGKLKIDLSLTEEEEKLFKNLLKHGLDEIEGLIIDAFDKVQPIISKLFGKQKPKPNPEFRGPYKKPLDIKALPWSP